MQAHETLGRRRLRACSGWVFAVTIIGIPVAIALWIAAPVWTIYRIIRGYLWFKESKPVPA